MLPDRVSNPGPLTYKSGALPIALRGPAYNVGSTRVPNATYQVPRSSALVLEKISKHIWAWRPPWSCDLLICINFHSHSPMSFHKKFGSKLFNSFREKHVLILKSE